MNYNTKITNKDLITLVLNGDVLAATKLRGRVSRLETANKNLMDDIDLINDVSEDHASYLNGEIITAKHELYESQEKVIALEAYVDKLTDIINE